MNWGDSEQGPSTTVQKMIGEQVAQTKATLFSPGGMNKWLIIGVAVVAIIFFVKKVT